MSVYSFPCFSVFSTYSSSCHVNLSLFFFIFQFYRHIPGPTVCISYFPPFSVFLAIFQTIMVIPGLIVCISFYTFVSIFAIFQVLQCSFLIFQVFQCFSPYFMSNNLCFSFSIDFQFSRHGPGPTVCLSLFPRF